MRNAARIVDTALAPIAGANGGELLLAPSDHAMNRHETVANPTRVQKASVMLLTSASQLVRSGVSRNQSSVRGNQSCIRAKAGGSGGSN